MKSDIICAHCGFDSITFEPFNKLTLSIPDDSYIKEMLSTHFDTYLFYIPEFCLGPNYRIDIHIPKETEFKDLAKEIKNIKDFHYKLDKLIYVKVLNYQFVKVMKKNEKKNKSKYIFAFDDKRKNEYTKIIPLYIYYGKELSASQEFFFLKIIQLSGN